MSQTILLVEDNEMVQKFNSKMLGEEGYGVKIATTLAVAKQQLKAAPPDIIVLDIGMPDGSGIDFLRELREEFDTPVLMLTGYNKSEDVVLAFDAGCDDYLAKPYSFEVLLVRLKYLLKNAVKPSANVSRGMLEIDTLMGKAYVNGIDLMLTPKNFALLQLFMLNENVQLSVREIYEKVWGDDEFQSVKTVVNEISRLRKKLDHSGYVISSVYGGGYKFEVIPPK